MRGHKWPGCQMNANFIGALMVLWGAPIASTPSRWRERRRNDFFDYATMQNSMKLRANYIVFSTVCRYVAGYFLCGDCYIVASCVCVCVCAIHAQLFRKWKTTSSHWYCCLLVLDRLHRFNCLPSVHRMYWIGGANTPPRTTLHHTEDEWADFAARKEIWCCCK